MHEASFRNEMLWARTRAMDSRRPDYWKAFQAGLQRQFYGDKFSSAVEHESRMNQARARDPICRMKGKGYRDGFNFRPRYQKAK
jgi:hypothetical protein